MTEAADLAADPRSGARAVRGFSRRILARARSRARLSGEIRRRADQGRLSRRADPRRIWRQRTDHERGRRHHGRNPGVRLQRRRLPRADVHDGHAAASRQRRTESALSARHRARRIAPAGVRRHRTDIRHRHAGLAHHGDARRRPATSINGQKIWTSRAEHSDLMLLLARTTPREQAASNRAPPGCRCSSSTCARRRATA